MFCRDEENIFCRFKFFDCLETKNKVKEKVHVDLKQNADF